MFIILTWDYFLMLGAMTFNVGIFFSIVGGVACGFLFMGHLFVSSAIPQSSPSVSTDQDIACCRYPQRVDVACSPQVASPAEGFENPPAARGGLLRTGEFQSCACNI